MFRMEEPVNLRTSFLTSGVFLVCFTMCVRAQSASENELKLGTQAYKAAKYEEAIRHFERAVVDDPFNIRAHLYLATALSQQYIPGAETPENKLLGDAAILQYRSVLGLDPNNLNAIKGIAYLKLQMKDLDEAKDLYRRATKLAPDDAEFYYSIGVIDWTQTYQPRMELRANLGVRPDQALIRRAECWDVRRANEGLVADGIDVLKTAIEKRPNYDDAMAYMNLMYRERADIQCGDPEARAADLKTADAWLDVTMGEKRNKAAKELVKEE